LTFTRGFRSSFGFLSISKETHFQPRILFAILDTYFFFGKLAPASLMVSYVGHWSISILRAGRVYGLLSIINVSASLRESCIIVRSKANIAKRPVLVWHTWVPFNICVTWL
jgi:hypothetical protein